MTTLTHKAVARVVLPSFLNEGFLFDAFVILVSQECSIAANARDGHPHNEKAASAGQRRETGSEPETQGRLQRGIPFANRQFSTAEVALTE
jgi:hypothetical protein